MPNPTQNGSLKKDDNGYPVMGGLSSTDGTTVINSAFNPDTRQLLVESTAGGVVGPDSSTDNAIVRWDGTTGEAVQNSLATIDDSGNVNAVSYKAGGTAPVADGTYTLGLGTPVTGQDGTITIKGGIITAVQEVM